jgi:hypothetical protein
MRIIKSDTGFLLYQKIFKQLMAAEASIVVWQVLPTSGKRQVIDTKISSLHFESGNLSMELGPETPITTDLPLYCFAEDEALIFKTKIQEIGESGYLVSIPSEIKLLEDPEVTHIRGTIGKPISDVWRVKRLSHDRDDLGSDVIRVKSMAERSSRDQDLLHNEFGPAVLDEEDKLFADKRESPRTRPKDDKFVKVAQIRGDGPETFKLFDLSRGGMGFLAPNGDLFTKGEEIHVVGFNDFDLDDPLVGQVMSIRPIDGQLEFKVGVKFSDGQN